MEFGRRGRLGQRCPVPGAGAMGSYWHRWMETGRWARVHTGPVPRHPHLWAKNLSSSSEPGHRPRNREGGGGELPALPAPALRTTPGCHFPKAGRKLPDSLSLPPSGLAALVRTKPGCCGRSSRLRANICLRQQQGLAQITCIELQPKER